jgi:NADH-ubiquinone/plastoquinone oxidoreductase, chain 3
VFGKANMLANADLPDKKREQLSRELVPDDAQRLQVVQELLPSDTVQAAQPGQAAAPRASGTAVIPPEVAGRLAWFAFWDILFFFGVLLVGFAYLWKRGDLDWVRSTAAEQTAAQAGAPPPVAVEPARVLVGSGS